MNKNNILIFPAGTEIAFEIQNALKYSKYINIYGGTSVSCHAEFVFKNLIEDFPWIFDSNFICFLNEIIDKYNIQYIYPAHDDVCLFLTKNQKLIKARIITSPLKTVDICRSKNKTYEYFVGRDYIPKHYLDFNEVTDYPVFVKPSIGQGSLDAEIVKNKEDLIKKISDEKEYAICEYLPGQEYTVDCFTDKERKLRSVVIRDRERIRNGIAVRSKIVLLDDEVINIANDINNYLEFNGAWFFQLKKDINNKYKLLEISARIPGTMGVSRNLGINYPLLTLYNFLGYSVDIINNKFDILLDRAFISRYKTNVKYSTVYIDFDDCIYLDDKVNIKIIAFLYQCVNKNKKIILLTKHRNNIYDSLKKYKIEKNIFDEIICINENDKKINYIDALDAIYIDDSFSERKDVFQTYKIPVYDLDMIESLLDWRM